MMSYLILFAYVSCIFLQSIDAGGGDHEAQVSQSNKTNKSIYLPLIDYLKQGYNPLAVPVCDNRTKYHVYMDMYLYQLFDLDEPTQMLTIDVWMEMSWFDCMLTWDPHNFDDINQISLPAGEIYHPDLIWYQSLHGNFEEGMYLFPQSVARVRSNGYVQLGAQALLKSFCRVDIRKFPFDTQVCNLTFASWNKDASVFNLTKKDSQDSKGHSFKNASNGEWEVLEFPAFNTKSFYKFGSEESGKGLEYAEVTFRLTLQRKPKFIKVYLIFPCVLLVWVSSLTFILPVESDKKIDLCTAILLAVILFLLLVSENIPRTSDGIPTLGIFLSTSIALVCMSVVMTAFVLNVHEKKATSKMPHWMKRVLQSKGLCYLCFRYMVHERRHSIADNNKIKNTGGHSPHEDEARHTNEHDWRQLANMFDRIFFVIYIVLAILNTIYIYVQEPEMGSFKGHVSEH